MIVFRRPQLSLVALLLAAGSIGCSVAAQTNNQNGNANTQTPANARPEVSNAASKAAQAVSNAAAQPLVEQSPSNTVREFYRLLRERRFRDALMMTNLRPAVEPLTATELDELRADFEPLAAQTPVVIDITGEQISGDLASVFVQIPGSTTSKSGIDEIRLRRGATGWTIISAEAEAEALARREGKNYFFKLRIDNYHANVSETIQDVIKAQFAYSLQHNGEFTDFAALVGEKLLPADILKNDFSGYRYRLTLAGNRKNYVVNAEPVEYGRTGNLSFMLDTATAKGGGFKIQSEDNKGKPVAAKN